MVASKQLPNLLLDRYVCTGRDVQVGGTSFVRKGIDRLTEEAVAIKVLEDNFNGPYRERIFSAEVKSLARLNHPNIIRLLGHGKLDDGSPYIVTEWIEKSLADILDNGPLPVRSTLNQIALPLASALAEMHSLEPHLIEHRDIKPANIRMRSDSEPVLIDFGFGKVHEKVHGQQDLTTNDARSYLYSPPWDTDEMCIKDVYSLGVVILKCLTGDGLVEFKDIQARLSEFDDVKPNLAKFLRRCINFDPDAIFRNGVDLHVELSRYLRSLEEPHVGKARAIRVNLTSAARQHIGQSMSKRSPSDAAINAQLAAELEDGYWVEYRKTGGQENFDNLRLATRDRIINLRFARDDDEFVATSASSAEFGELEAMRRRALHFRDALPLVWRGLSEVAKNRAGAEFLRHELNQAAASKHGRPVVESTRPTSFLDRLERSISIREQVVASGLLQLRVRLAKRNSHGIHVAIASGQFADGTNSEGNHLLAGEEFELLDGDKKVVVARGEVIYVDGDDVVITPRGSVRDLSKVAYIQPSTSASTTAVRRQRDALRSIVNGQSVNQRTAYMLDRPEDVSPSLPKPVGAWINNLDSDKQAAVEVILGENDLVVVQGPPGTGKTHLIAELVQQTLSHNPGARILLVSQTHVAVDNALERLGKAGVQNMVRLARRETPLSPSVEMLRLPAQMDTWREELQAKAGAFLNKRLEQLKVEPANVRAYQVIAEARALLQSEEALMRNKLRASDQAASFTTLTFAGTPAFDEADIEAELMKISTRRENLRHAMLAISSVFGSAVDIDQLLKSEDNLSHLQSSLTVAGTSHDTINNLISLQAEWLERLVTDESLQENFLASRSVLAGTAIGFIGQPYVADLEFDLCIIDEAAKATASELIVPISRARKSVLIGDSYQLPPLDDSTGHDALLRENGLTREEYTETLFEYLEVSLPQELVLRLTHQYRMVPEIGDLVSDCFYDGTLISEPRLRPDSAVSYSKSLIWFDTQNSSDGAEEAQDANSFSYFNDREIETVRRVLMELDEVGNQALPRQSVLVLAPYKAQVMGLRHAVRSTEFQNIDVECLTIDQVQGREADVTIFSVVRSNPNRNIGFLDNWRRLNVALSRARYSLFVVGNLDFARQTASRLASVIDHMERHSQHSEFRKVAIDE
jgi:serine/threonine protein kinase